jgi:hypothetical protein
MDFTVIAVIWAAVATVAALFMWTKGSRTAPVEPMSTGKPAPASTSTASSSKPDATAQLEAKLAELRTELSQSKERLTARTKEVEELKEQAKLKARREGKKDQREAEAPKGPDPRDVEIQSLRKGMASLESQLNALKRESASSASSTAELSQRTAEEVASARKAADGEVQRRRTLEEDNAALKKTLDELRNAMKKADARPDIPGTTLNLKELPTAAVQELSRYFRKGEEFERLYTVAQSQLQLEKDRYLELQRRYFAVCRELAVQTGAPANASDGEMQQKAEGVIDAVAERGERSDRSEGRDNRPPREPREPRPPREPREGQQQNQQPKREPEYQLGPDGQPLLGPDGQPLRKPRYVLGPDGQPVLGPDGQPLIKKRRRRRRRKIAGEPSLDAAGEEGGDDDGDDEGDEGGGDAAEAPKADTGAQAPT